MIQTLRSFTTSDHKLHTGSRDTVPACLLAGWLASPKTYLSPSSPLIRSFSRADLSAQLEMKYSVMSSYLKTTVVAAATAMHDE
jgi:hypothetical protein